jgi:D-apionolactonase
MHGQERAMAGGDPDTAVMLYGTEQPPAPVRRFQQGPLAFDLEAGKIRYIRLNGIEILRAIAFVVRGPGWESPAPRISDLEAAEGGDGLRIRYKAFYETAGGQIEVAADIRAPKAAGPLGGGLLFEAEARPLTDFTTARTGFCILHPAAVAGRPLWVTRPDESIEAARFPDAISAHQPFTDIRALAHEAAPGLRAAVRMEGDVWEMEDQRNWTDASFKTYGRPRDLPWPYTIAKGERLVQRALLSVEGTPAAPAAARAEAVDIALGKTAIGELPKLALAVSPEEAPHALAAAARLSAAPAQLIGWYEHGVQGLDDLKAYAALAGELGAPLGLELVLPCRAPMAEELAEAAALLRQAGLAPASIMPIQAPMTKWVLKPPEEFGLPGFAALYGAAREAFPGTAIGAGVTSNFTELNIDRPSLAAADYVTHATAGVIHEPDDRSVMETLETLPHIFRSVRAIAGKLAYRIGPSAIGMRYNPYGKTAEPNQANIRTAFAHQDPRQRALFGAAFALGYLARAAEAGLDMVCFGAPTGPFGLVYRKTSYPQPWFDEQDPAAPSAAPVYPLYHPLMAIAAARGAQVLPVRSSDEKRVLGLCYERAGDGRVLWLANLTAEPQRLRLEGAGTMTAQMLDAASFAAAARDPVGFAAARPRKIAGEGFRLEAYGVAALRGGD